MFTLNSITLGKKGYKKQSQSKNLQKNLQNLLGKENNLDKESKFFWRLFIDEIAPVLWKVNLKPSCKPLSLPLPKHYPRA